MNRTLLAVIFPLALLAACAHPGTMAKVDAALNSLALAETLALDYTRLPRCPAVAPCSDQATVDKIKAAATTAHNAVKMAEQNEGMLDAAITAVASFSRTIPATQVR